MIAPITHSKPDEEADALELPFATKSRLDLDGEKSWIILDEINEFDWPGHDLCHNKQGRFDYGLVPPALLEKVNAGLLASARRQCLTKIPRNSMRA